MEERRVLRAKVEGMAENRRDLDAQVKALEKELANRQQAVNLLPIPFSSLPGLTQVHSLLRSASFESQSRLTIF